MPDWMKFIGFLLVLVLILSLSARHLNAAVESCSANVSPENIAPNSSGTLSFTLNNTSSSGNIVWIKITSPSGNFTVTGGSKSGWSASSTSSSVTFTGGSQAAGATELDYSVSVTTGAETPQSAWTVRTSDAADGAGAVNCGGGTSVAISGSPADNTAPVITGGVTVTVVSGTSVTLTWTTNEAATSDVEYGTTDDYTNSVSEASATTSHSVTLTSLTANTTYHFSIISTDSVGNTSTTADNTFSNSVSSSTVTTTTATTTTTTSIAKKDTAKPGLSLTTNFSKPFAKVPVIFGTATDDVEVAKVEYSISGKNWLNVKISAGKSVSYSFAPAIFEDGDWEIRVRATDKSGNQETSAVYKLILDTLPPQVGATFLSLGTLGLTPDKEGVVTTTEGLEQKITLSAIGGPNTVEILTDEGNFALVKNQQSGLWSGNFDFGGEGVFTIKARAIDGAGNETVRSLNTFNVLHAGRVQAEGHDFEGALVSLYYFEPTMGNFVLWNGGPYGQVNPRKTDSFGRYSFMAPSGKYYLEVKAAGFSVLRSNIFSLLQNTNIAFNFNLKTTVFKIGSLSLRLPVIPVSQKVDFEPVKRLDVNVHNFLIGQTLNNFEFDRQVRLVTFLNTWLPEASSQVGILEDLNNEGAVVVFPQESDTKVALYRRRGSYQKVSFFADPEGKLVEAVNINSLPFHIFLDNDGVVRTVKVGVLTKEELLRDLR